MEEQMVDAVKSLCTAMTAVERWRHEENTRLLREFFEYLREIITTLDLGDHGYHDVNLYQVGKLTPEVAYKAQVAMYALLDINAGRRKRSQDEKVMEALGTKRFLRCLRYIVTARESRPKFAPHYPAAFFPENTN